MPTKITIDPKHPRLQKFLAGKGVFETDKPVDVEVSDHELTSLMRKAKEGNFENLVKVPRSAVKKASKANEDRMEARTTEIEEQEEPSDETTADITIPEAQEAEEDSEDPAPKRRRRS